MRGDVEPPAAPVHGELDRVRRDHQGRARPESRSIAEESALAPSTRSIARRYSGLARIDRGDGLAAANIRSKIAVFAADP